MSDPTNIFNDQNPTVTPSNIPPSNNGGAPNEPSAADLLMTIKNERGEPKYKSVEEALRGLAHAQTHIQTLEAEKRTATGELEQLRNKASEIEELRKVVEGLSQGGNGNGNQPPALTPEQVAALVKQTLTAEQQAAVAAANTQAVINTFKAKFGDKAGDEFYGRAAEMGMSKEELNALAQKSPTAVYRMFGIEAPKAPVQSSGAPSQSAINTTTVTPTQDSFIGRNTKRLPVGATSTQLQEEQQNARKMVEELESKGMSIDDLTNPKNFFKYFGR